MPVKFSCPKCKGPFQVREEMHGGKITCPHCSARVSLASPNYSPVEKNTFPATQPRKGRFLVVGALGSLGLLLVLFVGFLVLINGKGENGGKSSKTSQIKAVNPSPPNSNPDPFPPNPKPDPASDVTKFPVVSGFSAKEAKDWQKRSAESLRVPVEVTNKHDMKFVWIPPGTFDMGSPDTEKDRFDNETLHRVTLTKGFYMATTEVTQKQWQAVMGNNPSRINFKGDNRPVETVSLKDCREFCRKLGEKEGKTYRLPTEAEWEYACRAGTTTSYYSGNDEDALKRVGWYKGNTFGITHPVAQLAPNAWGLYDMHGNVCEWCEDWCGDHPKDYVKDQKGSKIRVLRGGCWYNLPGLCRSALRVRDLPVHRNYGLGLRLCLEVSPKDPESKVENPKLPEKGPKELFPEVINLSKAEAQDLQKRSAEGLSIPVEYKNKYGMKFVWIPPGTFEMGSPDTEEGRRKSETLHQVTLTKGFYMSTTEVTQKQWQAVMGYNPSHYKGDNLPVESVSWLDCQEFCRKLREKEGKTYRLPTEAEWEYACRAGTATPYYSGSDLDALKRVGWYFGNSGIKTHPVAQLQPNTWGLYDMHGNVCEWCEDWYGDYPKGSVKDPQGGKSGRDRVVRGGSRTFFSWRCRTAHRYWNPPDIRSSAFGLRLCLE